jgi:DUF1365 family protein
MWKIVAGIHRQALKLWLMGERFYWSLPVASSAVYGG